MPTAIARPFDGSCGPLTAPTGPSAHEESQADGVEAAPVPLRHVEADDEFEFLQVDRAKEQVDVKRPAPG